MPRLDGVVDASNQRVCGMGDPAVRPEGHEYSGWLGVIIPSQFQAALARFDLGDFVDAEPTQAGWFKQTVFVTSTKGEYVLRGRPVVPWQFAKERFATTLLRERSRVPVAFPYLLDLSTDIFGWPYALMPRLPGVRGYDERLTVGERVWVARAIGRNLATMQETTWAFPGDYDEATDTIRPFPHGYARWFVEDVRGMLSSSLARGFLTPEDVEWSEALISRTAPALEAPLRPRFVMGDYHPDNVLVTCEDGEWRVSGLVDLPTYHFGAREPDLTRLVGVYLDWMNHKDPRLAQAVGAAYVEAAPPEPGFGDRYALAMLRDRMQILVFEKGRALRPFPPYGWSFREYVERHVASYRLFAPDAA
jgi:aminoglycoside phosphotransferase (APT) family kinase protein